MFTRFLPSYRPTAQRFVRANRLWISGDDSAWTADMLQLHDQLTASSIPHTWVRGGVTAAQLE